jgi:hypothetical protein
MLETEPMVGMDEHDELENRYASKFEAIVSGHGVTLTYKKDRFGVDAGLQFFTKETRQDKRGHESRYFRATPCRVWFQLKGIHETTLSSQKFASSVDIPVSVRIDHLKFWYASPEPVYLTVYIEATDQFLAIDVRDLVEERWGENFYSALAIYTGDEVTVRVSTAALLTNERLAGMLRHRSMRIDGPAFRGRPLGHRIDPLRSRLAVPSDELWVALIGGILKAHDYELAEIERAGSLEVQHGILHQSLLWQSPAFTEWGHSGSGSLREEPASERIFGPIRLFIDHADSRNGFTEAELNLIDKNTCTKYQGDLALLMRIPELSSQRGLWRAVLAKTPLQHSDTTWKVIGLEALSYLILTCTLVYLDHAPELEWEPANYIG